MEVEEQGTKSRVVKVNSKESWDFHVNQATLQGCPVSKAWMLIKVFIFVSEKLVSLLKFPMSSMCKNSFFPCGYL